MRNKKENNEVENVNVEMFGNVYIMTEQETKEYDEILEELRKMSTTIDNTHKYISSIAERILIEDIARRKSRTLYK